VFTGDARKQLGEAVASTMCDPGQDRLPDDDPRKQKLMKKMQLVSKDMNLQVPQYRQFRFRDRLV
jgi:hypothetical protein